MADEGTQDVIEDIIDPAGEEAHEFGAVNTLLFVVVLATCFLFTYLIKKYRLFYLPESAAVILLGVFVGFIASKLHSSKAELDLMTFQPELFYFGLLPPLIFDAGYTCRRKAFFQNFFPIMLYAVLGTFISAFFIGYCTYSLGRMGWVDIDTSNPIEALLFGTLISAVNPVATLSVMDMIMGSESPGENCDPLLYSLVFGESVLNDAVAIVLFHTFSKFHDNPEAIDDRLALRVLSSFVLTSLGSVAIGTFIALACSYLCRNTDVKNHPELELSLLFLFAYGAYALAEALELSGIMALFFCGIVLAHYNSYNLSAKSRATAEVTAKTLSQLSENFVFLYIGMGFYTGRFKRWDADFIAITILLCLVGRVFNTFPLTVVANRFRTPKKKISPHMQVVIWFSGLRGAIAFALAQTMPIANRDVYVTTTLSVVIFTTVICGGLTEPVLNATGMHRYDHMNMGGSKGGGGGGGSSSSLGGGLGLLTDSSGDSESDDDDDDDESAPLVLSAAGRNASNNNNNTHSPSCANVGAAGTGVGGDFPPSSLSASSSAAAAASRRRRKLKKDRPPGIRAFWRDFDERYVKPTFGGSAADHDSMSIHEPLSSASSSSTAQHGATATGGCGGGQQDKVLTSSIRGAPGSSSSSTVIRKSTSATTPTAAQQAAGTPMRSMSSIQAAGASGGALSPVSSSGTEEDSEL